VVTDRHARHSTSQVAADPYTVGSGTVDFDQRFRTPAKCAHSGRGNEPVSRRRVPTKPPLPHRRHRCVPHDALASSWSAARVRSAGLAQTALINPCNLNGVFFGRESSVASMTRIAEATV
jgi:hypothetical protein